LDSQSNLTINKNLEEKLQTEIKIAGMEGNHIAYYV